MHLGFIGCSRKQSLKRQCVQILGLFHCTATLKPTVLGLDLVSLLFALLKHKSNHFLNRAMLDFGVVPKPYE